MWLAGQFAGSSMARAELGPAAAELNVTAYAATGGEGTLVAVFNKGQAAMEVAVRGMPGKGELFALTAPSLASTANVVFGKGSRDAGAEWTLKETGALRGSTVEVAAASAVLVRVR